MCFSARVKASPLYIGSVNVRSRVMAHFRARRVEKCCGKPRGTSALLRLQASWGTAAGGAIDQATAAAVQQTPAALETAARRVPAGGHGDDCPRQRSISPSRPTFMGCLPIAMPRWKSARHRRRASFMLRQAGDHKLPPAPVSATACASAPVLLRRGAGAGTCAASARRWNSYASPVGRSPGEWRWKSRRDAAPVPCNHNCTFYLLRQQPAQATAAAERGQPL